MGRPSKLTPERQQIIVDALGAGQTFRSACLAADVDPSNVRLWLLRGEREGAGPYRAFRAAVKKAENDAIMRHVATIEEAAPKHWTAAAWWLERRHPEEWGRRDHVDLRVVLEDEARRLAKEFGIDEELALQEVEAVLAEARR